MFGRAYFPGLAFILFDLCNPDALSAQIAERRIDDRVLSISGNVRTQTSYIERMVEECVDKHGNIVESQKLRQCLMNSRLFSEVNAAVDDQAIQIAVEERWTLIPIPFVQASSGKGRKAGLFLMESNFLGRRMNLAAGGAASNHGNTFFAFLTDPSLFFTKWSYNLSFQKQIQEVLAYEDSIEDEADGFNESSIGVTTGLGYKWHLFSVGLNLSRTVKNFSKYEHYQSPEDTGINRISSIVSFENRDFKLYFSEGVNSRLTVNQDVHRSDRLKNVTSGEWQLGFQQELLPSHALQLLMIAGAMRGGSKGDALRVGGGRGLRGLESKGSWVEQYVAGAIDYQIPIKGYATGTWTYAPFIDVGHLQHVGGKGKAKNFAAFGLGTYFFLRQIALPGLGLEVGYNNGYGGSFGAVSIGLGI